jgi:flagellar operon protein
VVKPIYIPNQLQLSRLNGSSKQQVSKTGTVASSGFAGQLNKELSKPNIDLKISKHAQARMNERQITISDEKWASISQKVDEAKSMGVKDSLVLTDKAAMVVSAQNKTVITVMNREEATKQIFSNINGTIVLD